MSCAFNEWKTAQGGVALDGSPVALTYEYGRDAIPQEVVKAIYDQLPVRDGKNPELFKPYLDGEKLGFRAAGIVGVFPFRCAPCSSTHVVVVGPKMAKRPERNDLQVLARVCDMAAYARRGLRDGNRWLHEAESPVSWSGSFAGSRPLWLFLALKYVVRLEELLLRDFRRYYVVHEETLQGRVKGKLKLARYMNRWCAGRQHELPCRWNEFTYNNWDNRILEAALRACGRYGEGGSAFSDLIAGTLNSGRFRLAFDEVTDIAPWEADFSKSRLRSVSLHYRGCLALAEQILRAAGSASPDPPLLTLSWIDTHELFEEFVFAIVTSAAREESLRAAQQEKVPLFTLSDDPKTRTDVEVSDDDDRCLLVVDAKYKQLLEAGDHGVGQPVKKKVLEIITADMYQLYFYLRSRKCAEGLIVFPYWDPGSGLTYGPDAPYVYNAPENGLPERRIRFLGLNLAGESIRGLFEAGKEAVRGLLLKGIRSRPDRVFAVTIG